MGIKDPQKWTWGENLGLKWLLSSQSTRYLGFPRGYNIKQNKKNDKILHQIRTKLAAWSNRKLLMAARILVTNQIVPASIWFITSCADLARKVLQKARTLVRNFVWGKNPDHNTRARVAWASAALPRTEEGIKVFNPYSQASALLAKMVTRELTPGPEPWKDFLRY